MLKTKRLKNIMKINITVRRRQQWECESSFQCYATASKEMLVFIAASSENVRI